MLFLHWEIADGLSAWLVCVNGVFVDISETWGTCDGLKITGIPGYIQSSAFNDLKMLVSPTTGLVQVRSPINPGVFNSPIPQRTQHVESWRAHGPLVGMCHRKRR